MNHPLTAKREKFCQLVAAGTTYTDAYLEAYQKPVGYDRKGAAVEGSRLMAITDLALRVQELGRPVIRKVQRKFEYNLKKALGDAEDTYNLAYEHGNANTMLAAIELRAKLAHLLTEHVDVTHRHKLLDDASTETLLAMRKEIEARREKQKKLAEIRVVNSETVSGTPHSPLFGVPGWVPSAL